MSNPSLNDLFEHRVSFPDVEARDRLARLTGIDEQKKILSRTLSVLVHPAGVEAWANKHHPDARKLVDAVTRRPPLVVLAGDVGCGKTELAESIGDEVARQESIDIVLFPMSLSTRGQGRVGEMTHLLSSAFDQVIAEASKVKSSKKHRGGIILLVDEADALAQSREAAQMHHEDRAGVNAFIRGVDRIARQRLPAAILMCTNRLSALDPAVRRRAASVLLFERPNDEQRGALLSDAVDGLDLGADDIERLVRATGPTAPRKYGFTFSDITQRLIPALVLDAYPDGPITARRAIEIAKTMQPTPPFRDDLP